MLDISGAPWFLMVRSTPISFHLLDEELRGGADNRVATEGDDRVGRP